MPTPATNDIKEALLRLLFPQQETLAHWIGFADGLSYSPSEFYTAVERELEARQVPGLEKSRVEFAEGGPLSHKRVYLRMVRERFVFDVCAAPFGTRFYFSCRLVEIPPVIPLWQLIAALTGLGLLAALFWKGFGFLWGTFTIIATLAGSVYLMRNAVALGLQDLDAALIKLPVLGPIYELFRVETYYRIDTRLMYLDTVSNVVKQLAEEVTSSKGVKLVRQYEQAPILGELYKPVQPRVETERKG